jgi:hypothetical protein
MATGRASLLSWVGESRPLGCARGTLGATQNLSPSWQIQFLFGYTSAILNSSRTDSEFLPLKMILRAPFFGYFTFPWQRPGRKGGA